MPHLPPREDRDWLTTTEIAGEAGVNYSRIYHWVNRKWVTPSFHRAEGSGDFHRWHPADLDRVREIRDTLDAVHELTESGAEIR